MSDASTVPEHIRLAAEQHGLGTALKLFPDGVKAAYERGTRPLGAPPKGNSPIASPAHIFNPARFEQDK
jgi:hypothetical protein